MPGPDLSSLKYFDAPTPLPLAHRGGALLPANEGIENSLRAFKNAVDLGYRYLETDVHCSADGVVYAFHDDNLERLTGDSSAIRNISSHTIDQARLGGHEPIPKMGDLLDALPEARFNIDIKSDAAVDPTLDLIESRGAEDRVCFASFSHDRLLRIRARLPHAASSMSPREVAWLKLGPNAAARSYGRNHGAVCAQVPHHQGRITVVTRRFVERAHALGVQVHVWTIDDPAEMNQLLDLGVDGLVSDRIDVLKDVLSARGQWKDLS
ncbi:MAG: glycerophosphodiester phosphodiesterase [Kineosporiaceae bacterium]|nr:glycerophosphodiester phosphodiesterase [Aeromicrobium sp.]